MEGWYWTVACITELSWQALAFFMFPYLFCISVVRLPVAVKRTVYFARTSASNLGNIPFLPILDVLKIPIFGYSLATFSSMSKHSILGKSFVIFEYEYLTIYSKGIYLSARVNFFFTELGSVSRGLKLNAR